MNSATPFAPPNEPSIAIVGVGLIGGSIAAALKSRGFPGEITGIGRNEQRLQGAVDRKIIDRYSTSLGEDTGASLVVVCTPVDRIVADVRAVAAAGSPGTLVTDAGSVKAAICRDLSSGLPDGVAFIGSHPLAGSEKAGYEHSDADLFNGRLCVITPDAETSEADHVRIRRLWEYLGARVVEMHPDQHDHMLALTSHLPHIVASALSGLLDEPSRHFAASGFRDTTRIAAGDPGLWTAIADANSGNVAATIDNLISRLSMFRDAIADRDCRRLTELLAEGKRIRDSLDADAD